MFVLRRLLRDSVESQFLCDRVLLLDRVCSVGCGFSVCAVFAVFILLSLVLFLGWLIRLWFQALLGLLLAVTGLLPSRIALLCLPHSHLFLRHLPILHLSGYRLSSDSPSPSVSLHRCLDTLPASGSPPPGCTIRAHGLAIGFGVLGITLCGSSLCSKGVFPAVLEPFSPFFPGGFSRVFSFFGFLSCSLGTFPVVHLHSIGDLQALSSHVSFSGAVLFLFFLPKFRAQAGPSVCPLPRSPFFGRSLLGFCWLSSGCAPLVTCVSCSAMPLSSCFSSFLSAFFLCLSTLSFSPFLRLPWVSSLVLS